MLLISLVESCMKPLPDDTLSSSSVFPRCRPLTWLLPGLFTGMRQAGPTHVTARLGTARWHDLGLLPQPLLPPVGHEESSSRSATIEAKVTEAYSQNEKTVKSGWNCNTKLAAVWLSNLVSFGVLFLLTLPQEFHYRPLVYAQIAAYVITDSISFAFH